MKKFLLHAAGLCVMAALMISFAYGSAAPAPAGDPPNPAEEVEALPTVDTIAKLGLILKEHAGGGYKVCFDAGRTFSGPMNESESVAATTPVQAGVEYSGTNVQVSGVDEGDIIQTDGKYIYRAAEGEVMILQAYPASEMRVVSRITFENGNRKASFYPRELYVDGDFLIIIGNANEPKGRFAKALVYDIADRAAPKKDREISLEGDFLSSRKIGQNVYLIANEYLYYVAEPWKAGDMVPMYMDSACGAEYTKVDLRAMRYFPDSEDMSHLFVAGFCLGEPQKPAEISSYLGGGSLVYCSTGNLYIARPVYNAWTGHELTHMQTELLRFALSDGGIRLAARGTVNGHPLNQFSMDEYGGYFRIAVTDRNDKGDTANNLYVLSAEDLIQTGEIEGMAMGEIIYSVRFMGEKGYIVTFRTVDPLFALDLSDPAAPRVTGELKIPGFSQYLHPYDETHLIGIGKETEVLRELWYGQPVERVVETGMKMALFDVTDPKNPRELFVVKIGESGTYSELLYNHKAFLFSKEKNLIAFPAMVYGPQAEKTGRNVFQGALVYGLDLRDGFQFKGCVMHTDGLEKDWNYAYGSEVERVLYIGDVLYTVSKGMVKASDLETLAELNSVKMETSAELWVINHLER